MESVAVKIPRRSSVAFLALLALILIVFSYVFTLALAAVCAILPVFAIGAGFGGTGVLILAVLGPLLTREQRTERAASLLSTAITIQLIKCGWTLHMQPGQFFLSRGEFRVVPSETVQAIRKGQLSAQAWQDWCSQNDLSSVSLAVSVAP